MPKSLRSSLSRSWTRFKAQLVEKRVWTRPHSYRPATEADPPASDQDILLRVRLCAPIRAIETATTAGSSASCSLRSNSPRADERTATRIGWGTLEQGSIVGEENVPDATRYEFWQRMTPATAETSRLVLER